MDVNDFHFLRPLWLWVLVPFFVVVVIGFRQKLNRSHWGQVCDPLLLPHILEKSGGGVTRWPWLLLTLAGVLTILALAGPTWERLPSPVFRNDAALVIVLDLSRSMDAEDIKPSRLERARYKIADIFRERKGGQTALVVYAADAFTVTPLTDDTETISHQLSVLLTSMMPAQGSRAAVALQQAQGLLNQAGLRNGDVLLVTDRVESTALDAAEELNRQGYSLFVLGVGTPEGAPIPLPDGGFVKDAEGNIVISKLHADKLQTLAAEGGGTYQKLTANNGDIQALINAFDRQRVSRQDQSNNLFIDQWVELGPWLVLMVLPLAALAFRRGYLSLIAFAFLPVPESAYAWEWKDLWNTPDQRGYTAYQEGDVSAAAEIFESSDWKAASDYAAGRYEKVLQSLTGDSADGQYNKGNAYVRLGRYPEAIHAYRKALEQNPNDQDAQYNKEVIEKIMEQQNQQSENQDSDQSDSSDSAADESQSNDSESQPEEQDNPSEEQSPSGEGPQAENDQDSAEQNNADSGQEREKTVQANQRKPETGSTGEEEEGRKPVRPDDPGGLLRRKFEYQYKKRKYPRKSEIQSW